MKRKRAADDEKNNYSGNDSSESLSQLKRRRVIKRDRIFSSSSSDADRPEKKVYIFVNFFSIFCCNLYVFYVIFSVHYANHHV